MTTFLATGTDQSYVVPPGKTLLTVDLHGASGQNLNSGVGGKGARLQATIAVIPGETLTVKVGKRSSSGNGGWPNGGGSGQTTNGAGGGGGSTSIWRGATKLLDAAGGGGAGNFPSPTPADGGDGGYPDGDDGWYVTYVGGNHEVQGGDPPFWGTAGLGGTQTAGGLGGTNGTFGDVGVTPGSLNQGGNGYGVNFRFSGAGGGGGLYGGGGGSEAAGGGGGSSGVPDPTATDVTHTNGENVGDGYAVLPTPPENEWWFDRVGF